MPCIALSSYILQLSGSCRTLACASAEQRLQTATESGGHVYRSFLKHTEPRKIERSRPTITSANFAASGGVNWVGDSRLNSWKVRTIKQKIVNIYAYTQYINIYRIISSRIVVSVDRFLCPTGCKIWKYRRHGSPRRRDEALCVKFNSIQYSMRPIIAVSPRAESEALVAARRGNITKRVY